MDTIEKQIEYYITPNGKCPYEDWYFKLDIQTRLRIDKRVDKLKDGLYGDHKMLQKSELSELRLDFGAGYRIYYCDLNKKIVLFVAGSSKKDQKRVIQKANEYYNDFKERLMKNGTK